MDCTGATLGNAAAVFGAGHAKHIAQHPEEGGFARDVDVVLRSINADREGHDVLPTRPATRPQCFQGTTNGRLAIVRAITTMSCCNLTLDAAASPSETPQILPNS